MKLIYATDLDRTLIFSNKYMEENGIENTNTSLVDIGKTNKSYIDNEVLENIEKLNTLPQMVFCPATSRSIDEYERLKFGFTPKYAIVNSGTIILHNGEPIKAYQDFVNSNFDRMAFMQACMDLEELDTVTRSTKYLDGFVGYNQTSDELIFDDVVIDLREEYKDKLDIIRQNKEIFVMPKGINKAVALKWLQHYVSASKLVCSGDSLVDMQMLSIADYAVVPADSYLVKDKMVLDGRLAKGGIRSPLYTIDLVNKVLYNGDL